MSYNNKQDDVIVFDPFDDEAYNKWLKARQEAQKNNSPQNPVITRIEFPTDHPAGSEPVQPRHTNVQGSAVPINPQRLREQSVEISSAAAHTVRSDTPESTTAADRTSSDDVGKETADKKAVQNSESSAANDKPLTPEEKKRRLIMNIAEIAVYLIMAVLIIKFVPKYVMERVSVEGESMMETLHDGDQLIGEKLSVRFNNLKRYDIIYFAPKGNHKSVDFIKRIIGLPGEMIYIDDSVVYVNGRPLQEDFAREAEFLAYTASSPIFLGEDEFFVMGDNRNHSTDSRSSSVGVVHLKDIEGRAVFRLWPLRDFGKID